MGRPDARILILGSMPGQRSLERAEYYGHPQNSFWAIMAELIGCPQTAVYEKRLLALQEAGIALWDVIGQCRRVGSLDSAIAKDSMHLNDFDSLWPRLPQLQAVGCNGKTAEQRIVARSGRSGLTCRC